jgi:hypothetical protein
VQSRFLRLDFSGDRESLSLDLVVAGFGLSLLVQGDTICSMNKFLVKSIITAATVSAE